MTDCPGSCNASYRRAIADNAADPGQPVPGEPVWCRRDASRILDRLDGLEILASLLEDTSDGYGEAADEPAHRSNGHAPSPSPRFDTLDEIESMLREWEKEYRRVKGWGSPPVHGHYATVSTEISTWLRRHFAGILESPFAYEFGDEVLAAARQLVFKAKAGSGYRRGHVPCPRCDHLLVSADGGHVYWCASCGRPVRKDEYDELCRAATSAHASR